MFGPSGGRRVYELREPAVPHDHLPALLRDRAAGRRASLDRAPPGARSHPRPGRASDRSGRPCSRRAGTAPSACTSRAGGPPRPSSARRRRLRRRLRSRPARSARGSRSRGRRAGAGCSQIRGAGLFAGRVTASLEVYAVNELYMVYTSTVPRRLTMGRHRSGRRASVSASPAASPTGCSARRNRSSRSRELGAGLVRVYVYWSQVEPEPGRFDWTVVDSFLRQLTGEEEVWVTVCSSSPWATQQPTDFLPPSPARGRRHLLPLRARAWSRTVPVVCSTGSATTSRATCRLLWTGTAAEYVTQLAVFHRAVRAADPDAAVVLGGCGYDVLSSAPDGPARQFFDHVVAHGGDAFDLFAFAPLRRPAADTGACADRTRA